MRDAEESKCRSHLWSALYLKASEIFGVEMAFREQSEEDVRVGKEGERTAALRSWAREALAFLGAAGGLLHSFLCLSVSAQRRRRRRMHGGNPDLPLFRLLPAPPLFLLLPAPPLFRYFCFWLIAMEHRVPPCPPQI